MGLRIALAGNPNSGKTSVFNCITGAMQKVGNWGGVTVEIKEGTKKIEGEKVAFVDLPGTYSLSTFSEEERVARDYRVIFKSCGCDKPRPASLPDHATHGTWN